MLRKTTQSIFGLLNLTFGALFVLLLIASLISWLVVNRVNNSFDYWMNHSLPLVESIYDIRSQSSFIIENLPNLKYIKSKEEVISATNRLLTANSVILEKASELNDSEIYTDLATKIQLLITKQSNVVIKKNELTMQADNADEYLLDLIGDLINELDKSISDLEFDIMTMEDLFKKDRHSFILQDLFRVQSDITKLPLLLAQVKNINDINVIKSSQRQYGVLLRNAATSLATVKYFQPKATATKLLSEIYSSFKSSVGSFNLKLEMARNNELILKGNEKIYRQIEILENQLGSLFRATNEYSDQSIKQLESTTASAWVILIASTALMFIVLAVAYFFLIPKRIMNPLKDATTAIVSLSLGKNVDYKLDIATKEMMQLNGAIRIFQKNAENLVLRENQLIEKSKELDKSDENLRNFLRVSSHDLRSPLRGVRLLCEFLNESLKSKNLESAYEYIEQIDNRINRLESLITSLLEYTKTGEDFGEIKDVDLNELIGNEVCLLNSVKGFRFDIQCDVNQVAIHNVPFSVVIRNLVDNAIKHHDLSCGSVFISVSKNQGFLDVKVEDDGVGIPKEYHDRVFKPFETLKPKDEVEGSGLGLAILSKLVVQIGGKIEVESPISNGRGSQFRVRWPIKI